jgi:hypothetical protein
MRVRWLLGGLAAACICGNAMAAPIIVIPTNQNGADTEIREFAIVGSELEPDVVPTQQLGGSQELATRGQNTTTVATGDRSSVMYMKFDISGLPNHNSNPAFWAQRKVNFRGYVRNTNLTDARIKFPTTDPTHIVNFDVRGLEPGVGRYADDNAAQANRTDRSGNSFVSPHYKYNWDEGIGTGANNLNSGITFMSAPGITPFCAQYGSCAAAYGDNDPNNIHKTLGVYDDFNDDARLLGNWQWPLPTDVSAALGYGGGANRYPVGLPLTYGDPNGNLKQLIFDAQDAGRTHITLMVNLAVDTLAQANGGTFPANTFLNHNYLFNPKEKLTLENDNNWDPDGALLNFDPGVSSYGTIGSPFSCLHATNCNGDGTPNGDTVLRALGDNSAGAFSPQLLIFIPEPTGVSLLLLGSLVVAAFRRGR